MPQKDALTPDAQLLVKLGSLIVHYQELTSPDGHAFDRQAINTLEGDEDVKQWLVEMDTMALLPKKRKVK